MSGETLKERSIWLELLLGEWPSKESIVASWADHMRNEVGVQRHLVEHNDKFIGEKMRIMRDDVQTLGEDLESKLQSLFEDVVVLKKAIL